MARVRCITEMGMGVDVHGRDATKAAKRAVSDAIRHSSVGFFRLVGKTPHDVVYEEDCVKLLRYHNEGHVTLREPLLICYALVNRPYILDVAGRRDQVVVARDATV